MKSQDFLATVLPTSGKYCACELSTAKKEHVFVETIEDLYSTAIEFSNKGLNAFYALSTFDANKRLTENAVKIKSLFLDIDCGEGKDYDSKQAAGAALDSFLSETSLADLGTPYILSSGGGLHVYWPLTHEVDIAVWKPVAENLKRLCKQKGFNIDFGVTGDASRVLRVPDTNNYKQAKPRPVKILVEGKDFELERINAIIKDQLTVSYEETSLNIPGKRPKETGATSVKLLENSSTFFKKIEETKQCAQLEYYKAHASEDGMEPLFFNIVSWARRCDDGYEWANKLGSMHPYDEDRVNAKWNSTKGPSPCLKLDEVNPGICTSCPHLGKITNPLVWGKELKTDNTEKEVVVDRGEESVHLNTQLTAQAPTVTKPVPPRNYSYGQNGGIYVDQTIEDAQGNKTRKQIMLLPYDVFVVDILNRNGDHIVHMVACRPEGSVDVLLPQRAVVSKDETVKALANQNIIAAFGSGNDKNLFEYVRACVEQASANKKATKIPNNCGWQEDKTFVYNSHIYTPTGKKVFVPTPGLENINQHTAPSGTVDEWRDVVNLFIKREIWNILTMGLVGPASLLMEFSGFNGMTYHLGSSESGTGKSLALSIAESFFGQPGMYRVGQATSAVALQQRQGILGSLPLITDEITAKNRGDFEWLPIFLLDQSQGKGKERMEANANKERLNVLNWKSTALLTSNTHVFDFLGGMRKHASQAEMLRVLEECPTVKLEWNEVESTILDKLKTNYGVAGDMLIRWMVQNQEIVREVYKKTHEALKKEFASTNDERYWSAGNAAVVAVTILLGSKYSNIIDIPVGPVIEVLRGMVNNARLVVFGSKKSAEDVLNAYTRENYGKFVVVKDYNGKLEAMLGDGGVVDQTITRSQIAGRVDHNVTPGYIDYYIEIQQLKSHCVTMSFGFSEFKKQLENMKEFKIVYLKKNMLAKTKGPSMRVNVMQISRRIDEEDGQED
jgi:hypothetical protein